MGYSQFLVFVEWFAAFLGVWSVWLALKVRIGTWPLAIASSGLAFYTLLASGLVGQMFVQAFYVVSSAWGWWHWWQMRRQPSVAVASEDGYRKAPLVSLLFTVLCGVFGTVVLKWIANRYLPDLQHRTLDIGIASFTVVAQIWLGYKWAENWVLWLVLDALSVWLFIENQLWAYAAYLFFLGVLAIIGTWQARHILRLWWPKAVLRDSEQE